MNARATLIATLSEPPSEGQLAALSGQCDCLEVRADLVGEIDPDWLRGGFGGELLYTLRSRVEGGESDGGAAERGGRLARAAEGFDLVDLEGERDLEPEVLAAVPAAKRVISWHGAPASLAALTARLERLREHRARFYKLVPASGRQSGDELPVLRLLAAAEAADVVAFASGPAGAWTRQLAPRLGAPVVYGSAGTEPAAPGQPSLTALRTDYGLPRLEPVERLFGIVGSPVTHSLSPRLHNGAYRRLGLPFLFVPFEPPDFGDFWLEVVECSTLDLLGFPLAGLAVTSPFKRSALALAGAVSPLADGLGTANTLTRQDAVWSAESTDPDGVAAPLERRGVELDGREAAVIGAGGAGRAAVEGLRRLGASVTLLNRSRERGARAAAELEVTFEPLAEIDESRYAVIVCAVPATAPDEPLPVAVERMRPDAVLVDLAYGPSPPPHTAAARAQGLEVVDGREVLLHQALPQFRLMTGHELPLEAGAELVGVELAPRRTPSAAEELPE